MRPTFFSLCIIIIFLCCLLKDIVVLIFIVCEYLRFLTDFKGGGALNSNNKDTYMFSVFALILNRFSNLF